MASKVVTISTTRPKLGFTTSEPLEVSRDGYSRPGRRKENHDPHGAASLWPSPRPHDLQWLGKGALNCPLLPQLIRTPSQATAGNRIRGQLGGNTCHMRKTPSPGTRRTPHSSHRHWAPPYWTNARPPPGANHHGAKVSASPPNKIYSEESEKPKARFVFPLVLVCTETCTRGILLFVPTPFNTASGTGLEVSESIRI